MIIFWIDKCLLDSEHVIEGDEIDDDAAAQHEEQGGVPISSQPQKA